VSPTWIGSTGNGRNPIVNGKAAAFAGGTSRMMREYHVRICEGLGGEIALPAVTPIASAGQLSKVLRTKRGFRRWLIAVPKPPPSMRSRADRS
jgi:hypothetical protein